ncbi:DUF874 domain-containing protein [Sulfitobacter mediterraneus]|uniref:GumC family protein n=2 Tax=Sulfitobacter mediterraneus TaxID=83219 RepID=UPI00193215C7|nr:DUF874 domain-containing protein [Sulfitobacter mediterraneus]MBM1310753.1 DUF874 domain-containing protein [Sulfitobacter mediterraneus]MBM1314637.1 DUF874 domain-containing protein [Sulfitobacter mediterraneus]MBM1322997.1 DUF874 domain-containing protein [Sulfitobacter mediterraneus]MBM1326909.1 DUF874 domain-containing protein [Sulfitobacter mediterraneus]MBM1398255.1 DUF874 domain-containing protein [Sulfitobacter mediterraneus]
MGPIYTLADFLDMLRRRAGLILFVFLLGCVASVFFALSQQHVYSSSEVIQVEQPIVKDDLAPSTVDGSSARRLQLIEQQVMARNSLLEVIDKFGLYKNMPGLMQIEKVSRLRGAISITGMAAVREGFADDGAISVITITANMDSPENAQAVAHEIADRTRLLAAEQREESTRETLDFFEQQEDKLIVELAALEAELTAFRKANDLSIEGSLEFRRDEIGNLNASLLELDREIISTQLARTRIDRTARAETVARQEREIEAQLSSLTTQRRLLDQRRTALSKSLETSPEVELELAQYTRRISQIQGQLDVVSTRRSEAEVGFSLEAGARSERMITLEEAQVPEAAITRSRKTLAMVGAVASVMVAVGIAFLLELLNPVVRSARQMERETGLRPVVSIPMVDTDGRGGFKGRWQSRREAGQRGRAARQARKLRQG